LSSMEKGKGKLIEDEESDQELNPQEQHVLEQESEDDEDYDSEDDDEGDEEEDDEDELQDLIEEAQEYGDGGDMVDGLRSGKYRQKFGDTSLNGVSPKGKSFSSGSSGTTGKRPAQDSLENTKNKCP